MLFVIITILLKCVKLHDLYVFWFNNYTAFMKAVKISFPVNFTMKKIHIKFDLPSSSVCNHF